MEAGPTLLAVAAMALIDPAGRVLMQRRPENRAHGGLWEFPGGKLEADEGPAEARVREIAEELGIALVIGTTAKVKKDTDIHSLRLANDSSSLHSIWVVLLCSLCSAWFIPTPTKQVEPAP